MMSEELKQSIITFIKNVSDCEKVWEYAPHLKREARWLPEIIKKENEDEQD